MVTSSRPFCRFGSTSSQSSDLSAHTISDIIEIRRQGPRKENTSTGYCGIDHESRVLRDRPSPLTLPSLLRSLSPRSVFATVPKLNPCSDKTADCAASASPAFGARRECRNGDRGSRRIAARKNLHETVRNDAGKCGKTRRYPHTPRACARLTGPGGVAAPPSVAERRRIRPKDCHPRIGALYTAISEPQW